MVSITAAAAARKKRASAKRRAAAAAAPTRTIGTRRRPAARTGAARRKAAPLRAALIGRERVECRAPPLPGIGTHVYRGDPFENGKAMGDVIYAVTGRGTDDAGAFAVAREMATFGVPRNGPRSIFLISNLVPYGIKPRGKSIKLRTLPGCKTKDTFVSDEDYGSARNGRKEWHTLPWGKKVQTLLNAERSKQVEERRRRHAILKIKAYIELKRRAAKGPLVKAALESTSKLYLDAHGQLIEGMFQVPPGMVIVFMTTPGALCFVPMERSRVTYLTSEGNARRAILSSLGDVYTVSYFEGDSVPEHAIIFSESGNGIYTLNSLFKTPTYSQPRPWMTGSNALLQISRMQKTRKEQQYAPSKDACLLSTFVRYMATQRKENSTMVLFLGVCRALPPEENGEVNYEVLNEAVQANTAARKRVSGPHYRPPPSDNIKKLKAVGEAAYLRDQYRAYKSTAHFLPQAKGVVDFVTWMREAGVDASAFK